MTESRRAKRKRAEQRIDVLDTMTERQVGQVGNISESGMMLVMPAPLQDEALYQFRLIVGDTGSQREIEVGAQQLWSERAQVPDQFWAGFRFIDIGRDEAAHLKAWIEQEGSEYV